MSKPAILAGFYRAPSQPRRRLHSAEPPLHGDLAVHRNLVRELLEAVLDHTQARILDLAPHLGVDQGSLTDSGQRGSAAMGRLMGLGAAIRQYGVCIVDILKSKHTF